MMDSRHIGHGFREAHSVGGSGDGTRRQRLRIHVYPSAELKLRPVQSSGIPNADFNTTNLAQ